MSVTDAHVASREELKKFAFVESIDYFSVAEYLGQDEINGLKPFEHAHDEYEFVFPLTTLHLIKYEKASYICEVGYCYPINPNVRHGVELNLGKSQLITIAIKREVVDYFKEKLGFKDVYFYTHFIPRKELLILIRKFQEAKHLSTQNEVVIDALAKQIIYHLIKEGLASGEDNRHPEKVYTKNIRKVLIYLIENYRDPNLNISQLAKITGYSDSYFSRSFKAYIGDSPVVHLNKLRLSEAKALFSNRGLKIKDIAHQVGYQNVSTFNEAFKKYIGYKPKEYRDKFCL